MKLYKPVDCTTNPRWALVLSPGVACVRLFVCAGEGGRERGEWRERPALEESMRSTGSAASTHARRVCFSLQTLPCFPSGLTIRGAQVDDTPLVRAAGRAAPGARYSSRTLRRAAPPHAGCAALPLVPPPIHAQPGPQGHAAAGVPPLPAGRAQEREEEVDTGGQVGGRLGREAGAGGFASLASQRRAGGCCGRASRRLEGGQVLLQGSRKGPTQ